MRTKARVGRSAIAAIALLATIGVSGLAPTIAAADTHTRTAPYDFGERCHYVLGFDECAPDPIAMTTGVVDRVAVCNIQPQPLNGCGISHIADEWSAVGIFLDVDAPGTLTVTVEAVAFGTHSLCAYVHGPGGAGIGCGGDGLANFQAVVAGAGVGLYRVIVSPDYGTGPRGLPGATAATVNTITYELAP